jgi:hypothetical protein
VMYLVMQAHIALPRLYFALSSVINFVDFCYFACAMYYVSRSVLFALCTCALSLSYLI